MSPCTIGTTSGVDNATSSKDTLHAVQHRAGGQRAGCRDAGARGAARIAVVVVSTTAPAVVPTTPVAYVHEILADIHGPRLARYNLECNLLPREFGGKCLSEMEVEARDLLQLRA